MLFNDSITVSREVYSSTSDTGTKVYSTSTIHTALKCDMQQDMELLKYFQLGVKTTKAVKIYIKPSVDIKAKDKIIDLADNEEYTVHGTQHYKLNNSLEVIAHN